MVLERDHLSVSRSLRSETERERKRWKGGESGGLRQTDRPHRKNGSQIEKHERRQKYRLPKEKQTRKQKRQKYRQIYSKKTHKQKNRNQDRQTNHDNNTEKEKGGKKSLKTLRGKIHHQKDVTESVTLSERRRT